MEQKLIKLLIKYLEINIQYSKEYIYKLNNYLESHRPKASVASNLFQGMGKLNAYDQMAQRVRNHSYHRDSHAEIVRLNDEIEKSSDRLAMSENLKFEAKILESHLRKAR